MATLLPEDLSGGFGGFGDVGAGPATFSPGGPPPLPIEQPPGGLLKRAWYVLRLLYRNQFTRAIGRDVLVFIGGILFFRVLAIGLSEEPPLTPPPQPPLMGLGKPLS